MSIGYTCIFEDGTEGRATWVDEAPSFQFGTDPPMPLPAHLIDIKGRIVNGEYRVVGRGANHPVQDIGLLLRRGASAPETLSLCRSIAIEPDGTPSWVPVDIIDGKPVSINEVRYADGRPPIQANDFSHPSGPSRRHETWNGELVVVIDEHDGWTLVESGFAPDGHTRILIRKGTDEPQIVWDTPTSYTSTPAQFALTPMGPIVAINYPNDRASYFRHPHTFKPWAPYVVPVDAVPEIVLNRPVHIGTGDGHRGTFTWSPADHRPCIEGTSLNRDRQRWSSFVPDDKWLMPFYDPKEASQARQNDPGALEATIDICRRIRRIGGVYDDDGGVAWSDVDKMVAALGDACVWLQDYPSRSEGFMPGPCFDRVHAHLEKIRDSPTMPGQPRVRVFLMVRVDSMLDLATRGQMEQVLLDVVRHINTHEHAIGVVAFGAGRLPASMWPRILAIWNALVAANERAREVSQPDGSIVIRPLPSLALPAVVVPPVVVVPPPVANPVPPVKPKPTPKPKSRFWHDLSEAIKRWFR